MDLETQQAVPCRQMVHSRDMFDTMLQVLRACAPPGVNRKRPAAAQSHEGTHVGQQQTADKAAARHWQPAGGQTSCCWH